MFEAIFSSQIPLAALSGIIDTIIELFKGMGVNGSFLLAQILNFSIFALIFYFLLLKPILRSVEERQRKIAEGLQYAEESRISLQESERNKAELIRKAGLDAAKIVQNAQEDAKNLLEQKTKEAIEQSESMIKRSQENMETERRQMIEDVKKEMLQLVVQTTEKVLKQTLDENAKKTITEAAAREISQ